MFLSLSERKNSMSSTWLMILHNSRGGNHTRHLYNVGKFWWHCILIASLTWLFKDLVLCLHYVIDLNESWTIVAAYEQSPRVQFASVIFCNCKVINLWQIITCHVTVSPLSGLGWEGTQWFTTDEIWNSDRQNYQCPSKYEGGGR